MQDLLETLIPALVDSTTFEDAAAAVLAPMYAAAEAALAASRYASKGKVLRVMVHLRPDDGYRALGVLECARPGERGDGPSTHLPSASAWRWVSALRAPVAIDVNVGRVEPLGRGAEAPSRIKSGPPGGALGRDSVVRLLERSSTHLFAVPLPTPSGIVGMVSIEVECRAAIGRPFIWQECGELLRDLAFVAAPWLASRPLTHSGGAAVDPLLPVVGAAMEPLVRIAKVFAQQDETLLLTGPTGAGKSRFARYCHARSRRSGGPFEAIDLLSIPDELQMGELFGWRKGAFSGALGDNPGALARAEGGTLFLDEIDKLGLKAQAGLLHVLEERHYRPLGEGQGERKADVRFVIGTNTNLFEAVKAGRFREDLYYRINVLPLRLPPLDERADEIAGWAAYMVARRHREGSGRGEARLSKAALGPLEARKWPGSLRQLDNVVRRAYALALVELGAAQGEVVLEERHVARALGYEAGEHADGPIGRLSRAAEALVDAAEKKSEMGGSLDLDLVDGLRGFVLREAASRAGGVEAAYRLLGKGVVVEHRNHKKSFRREMERVLELCRALGAEPPPLGDLDDER